MTAPDTLRSPMLSPPYVAVVFVSRRTEDDAEGYGEMAVEMDALAAQQPGYLGVDSARDPASRVGITVSYWRDESSALAWKRVGEHLVAQRLGRERWYEWYQVHVATVTRRYAGGA